MIRQLALLCALCLLVTANARAVEETDFFDHPYHLEHYRVRLNAVVVAQDCVLYVGDNEAVYVSSDDVDTWGLKRPSKPAFERDGHSYFGLQRDLRLAGSLDEREHELQIVAPPSAFRGQPLATAPVNHGGGAFANYALTRENGRYDLFTAGGGSVFQLRYLSTAGSDGLEFHRSIARWYRLNERSHSVVAVGDNTSDGDWLGISAPFGGIHYATDYTADPQYTPHSPPTVSGFASTPSLLEVYVDDVLELRTYVPAGPFNIGDLPSSSANSDVVLALTDSSGKRTLQSVRPTYDPEFLGRGFSQFRVDMGAAHANLDSRGQYYRGFVAQGGLAYGVTDSITANILGESISGESFFDAGADVRLSETDRLGFRLGAGNQRRASEYRYDLRRSRFTLEEDFQYNSLRTLPIPEVNDGDIVAQIAERSTLSFDVNHAWTLGLSFNRSRTSNGSNQSALSTRAGLRFGALDVQAAPFYDFMSHRFSADVSVNMRIDERNAVDVNTSVNQGGDTSAAVSWHAKRSGPNHELSTDAKITSSASQTLGFKAEDQLPWVDTEVAWEKQNGTSIFEPSVRGAFAFLGGRTYAVRQVDENESFGVLRIPGLRNVRVKLNASDAGTTDRRGEVLLRRLLPYAMNKIDLAEIPISYNIVETLEVTPGKTSPLALTVSVISHGDVSFSAVDDLGVPLAAGSWIDGTERYPVGYEGKVFIAGIVPGAHRLSARTSDGRACSILLNVPENVDDVPDLGMQRCAP